jgi:hypothetical protein
MANEIPLVTGSAAYRETVVLDGTPFQVLLQWNARDQAWTLGLSLADGTPLLAGMTVVPFWNFLAHAADRRLPKGQLVAVDLTARGDLPTRDDLGTRVRLLYVPEGERLV